MAAVIRNHAAAFENANQATIAVTLPSTLSASLIVVGGTCENSHVITGVTDNIGNTYAAVSGAASTHTSGRRAGLWRCLSATSGVTTVTVTFDTADFSGKNGFAFEITGLTSATADGGNAVNNGTASGFDMSGPSITTTSTTGVLVGLCYGEVSVNPKSGNEFTSGGDIAANTSNAACSLISSTAAAHQPVWTTALSSPPYCASIAAFKDVAGGPSPAQGPLVITGQAMVLGKAILMPDEL